MWNMSFKHVHKNSILDLRRKYYYWIFYRHANPKPDSYSTTRVRIGVHMSVLVKLFITSFAISWWSVVRKNRDWHIWCNYTIEIVRQFLLTRIFCKDWWNGSSKFRILFSKIRLKMQNGAFQRSSQISIIWFQGYLR